MVAVRALRIAIVLLVALLGLAVFLVYGGKSLSRPHDETAQASAAFEQAKAAAAPTSDVRLELEALAKRVDTLTEEIAQMRAAIERTSAAPPAVAPEKDFVAAHHDEILRLVAEDRDLRALPERLAEFRRAVISCIQVSGYPDGKAIGDTVNVLVETEKRFTEIRRRLMPVDLPPENQEMASEQYGAELANLRAWRRSELTRIVGEHQADVLIETLGSVQRF